MPNPPCSGLHIATRTQGGLCRGSEAPGFSGTGSPNSCLLFSRYVGAWALPPKRPVFESHILSLLCSFVGNSPLPWGLGFLTCNMGLMQLLVHPQNCCEDPAGPSCKAPGSPQVWVPEGAADITAVHLTSSFSAILPTPA